MTFEEAKAKLDAIPNGQIFKVDMTTPQTARMSASAKANGYEVFKHTIVRCRKGVEYSNLGFIIFNCEKLGYKIGKRKNGTKDTENKGFVNSTLGNKLADLYSVSCIADRFEHINEHNKPIVEYIVKYKGVENIVTKAELKALNIMQDCFFKDKLYKEKYDKMVVMLAEWHSDEENYPQDSKDELAKLIRELYSKNLSTNVEHINSIG